MAELCHLLMAAGGRMQTRGVERQEVVVDLTGESE